MAKRILALFLSIVMLFTITVSAQTGGVDGVYDPKPDTTYDDQQKDTEGEQQPEPEVKPEEQQPGAEEVLPEEQPKPPMMMAAPAVPVTADVYTLDDDTQEYTHIKDHGPNAPLDMKNDAYNTVYILASESDQNIYFECGTPWELGWIGAEYSLLGNNASWVPTELAADGEAIAGYVTVSAQAEPGTEIMLTAAQPGLFGEVIYTVYIQVLEELPEPERVLSTEDNTIIIAGDIPETVKLSTSAVAYEPDALGELANEYEILYAYDITLLNEDGTQWQPGEGKTVKVTLDVSSLALGDHDFLSVAHEHNGEIRLLGEYAVEDGMLTFEADGFSTFYVYVEILRGGYSYLIAPGKTETISLKALMADMGYTSFYCVTNVSSNNKNVISRTGWGAKYTNENGGVAYSDATLKITATKEFTGYVELTVKYHSTKARYESKKAASNLYTRVIRLYSSSVSVNTIDDVLQNDGVNVHLFNYGAAINDSSAIASQNSNNGFLPFGQGGYEVFPNIDQRYQYYKDGATDKSNAYENMSEIDGEATGNSYAAVMRKTLINGYPYISNNVEKDNAPTITSGSLQYLYDTTKTFVQGSGGLTNYADLTSIWDDATKMSAESATSTTGYNLNNNNTYQSMHFSTNGNSGLFQDVGGYYYYNSSDNAAYFDTTQNKFIIYDQTVVPKYLLDDSNDGETIEGTGDKVTGNFLPFNELTKYTIGNVDAAIAYGNHIKDLNEAENNPNGNTEGKTYRTDWPDEGASTYLLHRDDDSRVDLWFGVSADFDFYMPEDGKMYNNTTQSYDNMIYQFTGDDDVWVYIDDVLILDIGGCHAPYTGTINFATGEVVYTKSRSGPTPEGESSYIVTETTLYDLYEDAYDSLSDAEKKSDMGKKIKNVIDNGFVILDNGNKVFKDYTIHSFDFFYLERGGNISSMEMKFNLEPIQDVSLIVQKQTENLNAAFNDLEYTFKITAKDASGLDLSSITYTLNNQTKTVNADGTFTLRNGQAAIFDTFGLGYDIKVEETSTGQYSTTNKVTSGTTTTNGTTSSGSMKFTEDNKAFTVLFTNTWDTENLTITKDVIGKADPGRDYNLMLKLANSELGVSLTPYTGVATGDMAAITDGAITLKDDESVTISGLPAGTTFTLSETDPSVTGFKYQAPKFNGTIEEDWSYDGRIVNGTNTVTVTNRCRANLTITKTISGGQTPEQSFLFEITKSGENEPFMTVLIPAGAFAEGSASITISDLELDTYTVEECTDWSWRYVLDESVSNNENPRTVELDGNETVTFTNRRDKEYWLDGEAWCQNIFRKKDDGTVEVDPDGNYKEA